MKDRVRTDHMHITMPQYLMEYIETLANKNHTSRGYEISVCVLLRYLNDKPKLEKSEPK